jgi:hypothetical protein
MNPTTEVDGVFEELDKIFDALDLDPESDPTRINDTGITGEIARRRMSGEALRKILTDTLMSRIGYPPIILPYFHVIEGE